ncbi:hypothetical protein [Streptomyces atratus]|uniref:hypothetical protein n=1 Tax=Streptomyces atratus TaxID=1893 RepID=UPI00379F516D
MTANSPVQEPAWWPALRNAAGVRSCTTLPAAASPAGGKELSTLEALNALMRDDVRACPDCDASAVLIPALELGGGYG